jgi:hypothetical protein
VAPNQPAATGTFDFVSEAPVSQIIVCHPFRDSLTIILQLPAWDHPDGGLHFGLLISACAIVAQNAIGGFLSTSRDPADRIVAHDDDVVAACKLWFFVPDPDSPSKSHLGFFLIQPLLTPTPIASTINYNIATSFDDWHFPHNNIPEIWTRALPTPTAAPMPSMSAASSWIREKEGSCRMSGHTSGLEPPLGCD